MRFIKQLFIFILILSAGCSGTSSTGTGDEANVDEANSGEASTGSAQIDLRGSDPGNIDWFKVTITASDMDTITKNFTLSGDVEAVIYNIPAGSNRTFTISAYDSSDALIFEGSAVTNIIKDETAVVTITLVDMGTSGESVGAADITVTYNLLPRIDFATASSNDVGRGETVNFTATASDPNGDTLTYAWSADCGSLSSTTTTSTTWTAPSTAGTCTITILVEDGKDGEASLDMDVTVS